MAPLRAAMHPGAADGRREHRPMAQLLRRPRPPRRRPLRRIGTHHRTSDAPPMSSNVYARFPARSGAERVEALAAADEEVECHRGIAEQLGRAACEQRPRSTPLVVDRVGTLPQQVVVVGRSAHVAAPPRQVRGRAQRTHPLAGRIAAERERAGDPVAARREMAVGEPEPPQGTDQPQRLVFAARCDEPLERVAKVVVLGLETLEPRLLPGSEEPMRALPRKPCVGRRIAVAQAIELSCRAQLLEREGANRLGQLHPVIA